MPVTAELISIGDELLIGQVVNTNASTLSKALNEVGIVVERITTVGDDREAILTTFNRAWSEHDVVIVTGGLGPTHDDISKDTVAQFFETPLEMHEDILAKVRQRFERLGARKMPESNESQGLVPKGFTPLSNDVGTAPGLYLYKNGKVFAILPGVPSEMEWILNDSLLDHLRNDLRSRGLLSIVHRTLIVSGIGESMLAEKIGDIEGLLNNEATLAFLPRSTGVRLRLTARGSEENVRKAIARIIDQLYSRVGTYIVGEDEVSVAETLVKLLSERSETVGTAESCTGGLVGAAITDVPGSSKVFLGGVISYSNDVKRSELDVPEELLLVHGAVSKEVALVMAESARKKFGSTYALAVTGVAGPDGGTDTKSVGLVYIALAHQGHETAVRRFQFLENRRINRERSVAAALEMLRRRMMQQEYLYETTSTLAQ